MLVMELERRLQATYSALGGRRVGSDHAKGGHQGQSDGGEGLHDGDRDGDKRARV
jgi:hypothetical protein